MILSPASRNFVTASLLASISALISLCLEIRASAPLTSLASSGAVTFAIISFTHALHLKKYTKKVEHWRTRAFDVENKNWPSDRWKFVIPIDLHQVTVLVKVSLEFLGLLQLVLSLSRLFQQLVPRLDRLLVFHANVLVRVREQTCQVVSFLHNSFHLDMIIKQPQDDFSIPSRKPVPSHILFFDSLQILDHLISPC